MKLEIVDKHNVAVPFEGFVVTRHALTDLKAGAVYPYGYDADMNVLALDDAKELQTLDAEDYIFFEEGMQLVTVLRAFPAHNLLNGAITRMFENLPGRSINSGCVWLQSVGSEHDVFAARKSHVKDFKRVLWSAQAYRYRMQSAQRKAQDLPAAGTPKLVFVPEEVCTQYVTVEFKYCGKQYNYLLPAGMTARKGDDAVVVVNNPAYPELKGTKVVRVTGVYDRNPSDYYDGSLKRVEHIVSKAAERRKEIEQKVNDKRIQLREAEKRVATLSNQLTKLEEDLVNGNY